MEVKKISPFLSVAPQIHPAHVERLAALGFRTIINNRPDNEADDQPLQAELAKEAAKHGIVFINIPVIPGQITAANVREFGNELSRVQGPVLTFCRTGTRSTCLWAMHEARHMSPDAIIGFAATIGYDLGGLKDNLEEAAARARAVEGKVEREYPAYSGCTKVF